MARDPFDEPARWHLTGDVEVYAARAGHLLEARPAENTVALTVVDGVRAGRYPQGPAIFGWSDTGDGEATGAVSLNPPFGLLLAVVPPGSEHGLVAVLRENGTDLPTVFGEEAAVAAFARAWTAGTELAAVVRGRQRLYALGSLVPPDPAPRGRGRPAEAADQATAARWWEAAQVEMGAQVLEAVDVLVASRIEAGLLWLWEDQDGVSVSLAGRNAAAAGVSRVGPVYTPPEYRRRGYGAAVTAAVTAAALREDAEQVVLFTDLANPTSNAIYQQIGYRPVSDRVLVRFDASQPDDRLAVTG